MRYWLTVIGLVLAVVAVVAGMVVFVWWAGGGR
jgi:hypothetical protein